MASPELAIAKAALAASLFKADPVSLSRQDVDGLFPLLDATVAQCSRHNVQSCKNWIVAHVASSSPRCANLAKYLAALSKSFPTDATTRPSLKRRRLHILYLVSDALHHAQTKNNRTCADAWASHLVTLIAAAASFDKCPKHKTKLENLISLWYEKQYFAPDVIAQFRDAVSNNGNITATIAPASGPASTSLKVAKDAPYTLPSSHGDPSTPWYDLPVATWLPHLTPNSARPMMPDRIRPIQLSAGLADAHLVDAVKKLLRRADRVYTKSASQTELTTDTGVHEDINELGERFLVDDITGEVLSGDTYYGWSRPFCEKMRARKKQTGPHSDSHGRSYSRSTSPESRGRRSEGYSPSRKRARRYSSDSRSRSPTPPPRSQNHRSSPDDRYERLRQSSPPKTSFPGLPPPPPPQAFSGQWPPPPPPPPGGMPPNWTPDPAVMSQMMAAWSGSQGSFPPPPPPPPPPQQEGYHQGGYHNQLYQPQQQQHTNSNSYNRRGGYNNYRGRGGYDRGRGR